MATIMRKMNIISRCEAIYREKNSSDALPGIYHSYILAICKNPGLPQEKLAKYLCINKSSVTRHLAYLEKNGYIKREPCTKDKREHLVFPTDKMTLAHSEVVAITKEWNGLIASGISEAELELFHSVMDRMLQKSSELIYTGGDSK
ncbi:MAG: MarR family transcriptional regulator [Clostridia bacterium]|nr:MarR family transcriptional regulator [Clostridia bacterium]